jgi:hypothetical protein
MQIKAASKKKRNISRTRAAGLGVSAVAASILREAILKWLVAAAIGLVCLVTLYSVASADTALLDKVMGTANTILVGALGWALGRVQSKKTYGR